MNDLIKKLWPVVAQINDLEAGSSAFRRALRAKTLEFRARIAHNLEGITGEEEIKSAEATALEEILPEAFAVVREAGWRAVQMRHFDVQLSCSRLSLGRNATPSPRETIMRMVSTVSMSTSMFSGTLAR